MSGRRVTLVATVLGAISIVLGLAVVVGWHAHVQALIQIHPTFVAMQYNTALCFVLSGLALVAVARGRRRAAVVLGALVGGFAGLTLLQYPLNADLGLDQLFFKPPSLHNTLGRMAPMTATCFSLLGIAVVWLSISARRSSNVLGPSLVGSLIVALSAANVFGYVTRVDGTEAWFQFSRVALHTAVGLGLLGAGLFLIALRCTIVNAGRTPRWLPGSVLLSALLATVVLRTWGSVPTAVVFAVLGATIMLWPWGDASTPKLTQFSGHLWRVVGCAAALAVAFVLYAWAKSQIDRSNERRYRSVLLADELRQSSDDLTRMIRTYVITGDPVYKQHYQDILAIRDGRKPRPEAYERIYWDLVLMDGQAPRPESPQTLPLLELMRQAGITEEEFRKLAEAKVHSDGLTIPEFEAMKLVESIGPEAEANRAKARGMIFDAEYHQAKAAIMKPIDEFYAMVSERTLAAVHTTQNTATIFLYLLVAFGLGLMFALWRVYAALNDTLGGSVDQVYTSIAKIGSGDFSGTIQVKEGLQNSVLSWLSETQAKLNDSNREQKRSQQELQEKTALLEAQLGSALDGILVLDNEGKQILQNDRFSKLWNAPAHIAAETDDRKWLQFAANQTKNPQQFLDKLGHLFSHPTETSFDEIELIDGTVLERYSGPVRARDGKHYGRILTFHVVTERKRAEETLRESNEKFCQLAENITDVFYMTSPDLQQMHYVSPAYEQIWGRSVASLYAHPQEWADAILPEDRERVWATFSRLAADESSVISEFRIARPNGGVRWILSRGFQVRDAVGKVIRITGIATDITERKLSASELAKAHKELVEASRRAGMSEIATNVLHNVGNVLNSVNVSAELISEKVNRLRPASLAKVAALLREHTHDLPDFLTRDPQGKALPGYLSALAEQLADPQKDILPEVVSLRKNIEHIRAIVRMQQNYAHAVVVRETIALADLVEDAIRINAASLTRHEVQLVREYSPLPSFPIERHKVLQILVNLLSNARHALDAGGGVDNKITVRIESNGGGTVKVSVKDNGVGIAPENLTAIFQHGFTTRKDGHGFGLHSGALAAQEMGASLTASSGGLGQGAIFTLELPCQVEERAA